MVSGKVSENEVKRVRFPMIDAIRGAAIIGVAIYHLIWDLRFLQFTGPNAILDPVWIGFAKALLASFLLLAGASLVLAHGEKTRWGAFWKRFGVLAGAALVVSAATYFMFRDGFVYFGILHALAVFSLIGVFFVRAPLALVGGLAVVFLFAHFFIQSDAFNVRYLTWIGFWTVEPYTQDLVPMFPGLGFVFAGIVAMRVIRDWPAGMDLLRLNPTGRWFRILVRAGRWSLVIYLVHQPILLGILIPLANWVEPGKMPAQRVNEIEQAENFYSSCVNFCIAPPAGEARTGEAEEARCQAYCSCAVDLMEENGLLGATDFDQLTAQQKTLYSAIPSLCRAMGEPPALSGSGETEPLLPGGQPVQSGEDGPPDTPGGGQ